MSSEEAARPLPKFGEWDVNDPSSAEGFTMIFNKARDEKKAGKNSGSPGENGANRNNNKLPAKQKKWFCCG